MQHLRIATRLLFGIVALAGVQTAWADVVYSFTTIDVPGSFSINALGTNDSGQIVGAYFEAPGGGTFNHGFLYTDGSFTTIPAPGTCPMEN